MCSNFEPINTQHSTWMKTHFNCDLPSEDWRAETYPTYSAPFIYIDNGKPKCELAQFGLVPHWAKDIKKFGFKTYNARSETVHEKPSYRHAWRELQLGLIITQRFYEPCYETGKAIKTGIFRADGEPTAIECIWERFVDKETGEVIFSFSMLTVNADHHNLMRRFHRPMDEKRSVVVIENNDFSSWLTGNHQQANSLIRLSREGFLTAN